MVKCRLNICYCNELASWIIQLSSLSMRLHGKSRPTENPLRTSCIPLNLVCSCGFTISIKDTIRIIRYGGTCPTRVIEYSNLCYSFINCKHSYSASQSGPTKNHSQPQGGRII